MLSSAAAARAGDGPAAFTAGDRTGWSIVPSPNGSQTGDNTLVQVSASSARAAWAVGYDGGPGAFRTLIQRWNGSKWTIARSPSPSPLDNVLFGVDTLSSTSAWAVGYDIPVTAHGVYHRALIEHWNGSTWQAVPAGQVGSRDSDLWGVTALSRTNAWAVGNKDIGAFTFRPLVEHWNGAAWKPVPVPSPRLIGGNGASLFGVAATSPRDIWAVGDYDAGTRFQPLIEHWNGARWSLIPASTRGSAILSRISMQTPSNGWAVGIRGASTPDNTQALIEHWNGQHWTTVRSPTIRASSLADVLALTPHLAWAVGTQSARAGSYRTLIERWNGRAWTVTPSPNRRPSSELLGIDGTQRHIWSVGDSLTSTLILRYGDHAGVGTLPAGGGQ
jgi:hypothetical protein